MNIIAGLEFKLAYYNSTVKCFNHYTTGTPSYVCVCVCVCMSVCVYMYVCVHVDIYIYIWVCVNIDVHNVYVCMYMYVNMCVYMYMCVYIYMCMCVSVCMYICKCMYVCVYVCIFANSSTRAGKFLVAFNRFEFRVFLLLDWLSNQDPVCPTIYSYLEWE